jgi:hypothetical protein
LSLSFWYCSTCLSSGTFPPDDSVVSRDVEEMIESHHVGACEDCFKHWRAFVNHGE